MKKRTKTSVIAIAVVLVVAGGIAFSIQESQKPGELDAFASCIKDSGAIFYGAFWCPHCVNQKEMFGRSARLLPYVECSTPDGKGQLGICRDKGVTGYPTWEFKDGSRLSGEISLSKLSEKTGCALRPSASEATALPETTQ